MLIATQEVESLYSDALDVYPNSAWLHIFIAQHIRVYRGNRHLELLHLTAAEVLLTLGLCLHSVPVLQ